MKEEQKDEPVQSHRGKNGKREKVPRKKLYSTVGTPDYIAIEVLYQKGMVSIYNHVLFLRIYSILALCYTVYLLIVFWC